MDKEGNDFRAILRAFAFIFITTPGWATANLIVAACSGLTTPIVFSATGILVSRLTSGRGSVIGPALLVGAAFIGRGILDVLWTLIEGISARRFANEVDLRVMQATGGLPGLAYFEEPELANLVRVGAEAGNRGWSLLDQVFDFFRQCVIIGTLAVISLRVAWWAPVLLALTAVPKGVQKWRRAEVEFELYWDAQIGGRLADYQRTLSINPSAAKETRLFGLSDWLNKRQSRMWQDAMKPVFEAQRATMLKLLRTGGIGLIVSIVPFGWAFARLNSGALGPGPFTASMLAMATILGAVDRFADFPGLLRSSSSFLSRLFRLIHLTRSDPRLSIAGNLKPPAAPEQGLRLESVTFRYPGVGNPVLEGCDLTIPAGQSLALVGVNGAGKSTLVKLLCRFYDPDEGRITLDGTDIRDFDLTELRRRMAVVFQDFTRFPLTAGNNVGFGCIERRDDFSLLDRAAARTGAASVVDQLPERWASILGHSYGGVDISEGQWQRLALARAMTAVEGRNASILILDEPTAALDVRMEQELYASFRHLAAGRTTLLISHRLSTVRMAHRIALLDAGRVTEQGSHAELLDKRGVYAHMWEMQARRFREEGALE